MTKCRADRGVPEGHRRRRCSGRGGAQDPRDRAPACRRRGMRASGAGERAPPMCGIPVGIKDLFCTEGVASQAGSKILEGFRPEYESTVSAQLRDAGAGDAGQAQHGRIRPWGSSNETSVYGNAVNSVARRELRGGADAGRFLGRVRRRRRRRSLPWRDGHRHRRLDPATGGLHGHGWPQAHLWTLLALGDRGLRLPSPRSGGTD